ncbi:phosphatidate cytidylyltransferase [Neobacillus sp. OS1-32]|jgi:phosphatidate cytidylyltransferase|uniref:Phosphatidate cytidylyltransferase n=1 Tax=Neobacillus paridis TaxID=2803862 RepID=A0ABS1TN56_9BACI|nr:MULTISPECIES: phosphatidate cytidylyltransferase [Neobacillus]MBL4952677.1 phosphatidate cytidylyltransferase [Neobacillus paridis]WML31818.1 phosphatidate cytidylyltransferase [Neobacillus sp. OS1-32]
MKQRIITAVVAAALFLPIVIYGRLPFVLMTYLLATVGLFELLRMKKLSIFSPYGILTSILLWTILLPNEVLVDFYYSKTEIGIALILLLLSYTVITKNRFDFENAAFTILSAIYVGIGFYFFIQTREAGLVYIFYSIFIVWATDSGAYFVGRAYGRKKLWPEISPNKTVEGFFGGIISAVVVGILFGVFSDINATIITLIAMTVILSVFGQLGDLVQSAYKRHFNVKDSGNILPGHGGILDRFDSLLFVLPLLSLFHIG